MKKLTLILFSALTLSGFSQEKSTKPERLATKHEVGFAAGHATGVGISYRYYPKKIGIQITTTPIISSNDARLSIGTSLMYTLNETRVTKFYLYYGNHVYFEKYQYQDYYYYDEYSSNHTTEEFENKNFSYNTGVGAGIELTAWQRVGFNFNFGLGYHYEENTYNNELRTYWSTTIIGGGGIFYKF